MNKIERAKLVKAMEYICRNVNNEEVFEEWLILGVGDGDIAREAARLSDGVARGGSLERHLVRGEEVRDLSFAVPEGRDMHQRRTRDGSLIALKGQRLGQHYVGPLHIDVQLFGERDDLYPVL